MTHTDRARLAFARSRLPIAIVAVVAVALLPARAQALTPESPEVKAAIAKALKYLEANDDGRSGARALAALTFVKAEQLNHPKVDVGLRAVMNELSGSSITADIYTVGIAIIFLTELDAEKHAPAIQRLLDHLQTVQKPHGGWGYPHFPTGDTSMTQYAVLGMWMASNKGFSTPLDSWERVTNWLMRTQAADGAFGYQGNDPGTFEPAPQTRTTLSMGAAGSGSLYLCGDYLGLIEFKSDRSELPAALKRIEKKDAPNYRKTTVVDAARWTAACSKADGWMNSHFAVTQPQFALYYLYALERYKSFKELASGTFEKEPSWYTDCAKFLIKEQSAEGAWRGPPQINPVPDTCFGTLFLLRSMKKAIEQAKGLGAGILVGGRGLPANASEFTMRSGNVVAKALAGPAEKMLAIMEDPNDPEFARAIESLQELTFEGGEEELSQHAQRLRALIGSGPPEARAAALRALARTRNMDDVPLLIEALKDPDALVVEAASEALRFVSRRLSPRSKRAAQKPVSSKPTDSSQDEPTSNTSDDEKRLAFIQDWKDWYKSIRPAAAFED
jgi:hypothetical protein